MEKKIENNRMIQFWMIRLVCLIEFVLKEKDQKKK
jgi:hypothetical protein